MKRLFPLLLLCAALWPSAAHSFCGFYVSSGDSKLFNKASLWQPRPEGREPGLRVR
jgi:hypothetical protein